MIYYLIGIKIVLNSMTCFEIIECNVHFKTFIYKLFKDLINVNHHLKGNSSSVWHIGWRGINKVTYIINVQGVDI